MTFRRVSLRVGGDGSTCDSLGAALGRRHAESADMMTVREKLTCKLKKNSILTRLAAPFSSMML